ncbi:hypothetical protein ACFLXF_01115 [Chloroflexota bacterium]
MPQRLKPYAHFAVDTLSLWVYTLLNMGEARTVGIIVGVIIALVSLVSTVISMISYGLESPMTIIFAAIFIVGLLVVGLAWGE